MLYVEKAQILIEIVVELEQISNLIISLILIYINNPLKMNKAIHL